MLWTFASQNKETSRAVQHARTLKIKYLSPVMGLHVHPDLSRFLQPEPEIPEPESRDRSHSPLSFIRRLASSIFSLKRRSK
jgi:hypothetical protein